MWAGTPKNPYSQMVYENGEPCWQGGSRSTTVSAAHTLWDKQSKRYTLTDRWKQSPSSELNKYVMQTSLGFKLIMVNMRILKHCCYINNI